MFKFNWLMLLLAMFSLFAHTGLMASETNVLDDFETLNGWRVIKTEGVHVEVAHDAGHEGMGMRLDFDFGSGAGYALVRKELPIDLPPNYEFSFFMRADAPRNNLEYKLVDPSGKNVWWWHQRDYEFPRDWQQVIIKKRHLAFAWGPANGGDIGKVEAIEIAITAGTGGKGSIWLDDLTLTQREPVQDYALTPLVQASTTTEGNEPAKILDNDAGSSWRSGAIAEDQWLELDFQQQRVYGGLMIDWDNDDYAVDYQVEVSDDGEQWRQAYSVQESNGGRDYLYMPDTESRYLRLNLQHSSRQQGYAIHSIDVKPYEFSLSVNRFFESLANDAQAGTYPQYFSGKQSYWTVIGARGDDKEALINQQGAIEVDHSSFTIEPFLYVDGSLVTWKDVELEQSLEEGYLPIPSVTWRRDGLQLTTTAAASGVAADSSLYARYRLQNTSDTTRYAKLYLAIRPFQVNPPWQSLNQAGGVTEIHDIEKIQDKVIVNANKMLNVLTPATGFGAATFYEGSVTEYLRKGELPKQNSVQDSFGYASAALSFDFELQPGEFKDVYLSSPFHQNDLNVLAPQVEDTEIASSANDVFVQAVNDWRSELDRAEIRLPSSAQPISNILKSTIAYILINMDGPAIQPGSRSYERSWIRDGALTSTALLQMGYTEEARNFIQWYAGYQFDSGKVPCCVDYRGADPIPEHDSNGAFIYLIMEYYRYTHDVGFIRQLWPKVVKAVDYIESLRQQRLTEDFQLPENQPYYGLVPASISHEGYAANPVHSYWDDFFVMRGLKDAADMASILGEQEYAVRYGHMRDDFRRDLYASLARSMAIHGIDFIPGAVELGDFDAPSTAIAVSPVGELGNLPADALKNTLDKYFDYFEKRRAGQIDWNNYSPYESRIIETFVRMSEPERAHELLDFLLTDQRPSAWNEWAEIVWRDPAAPRYIGDMPHTWVGSEFIRSVRSMFVYERESDNALVIAAGLRSEWVTDPEGIDVKRLPTHYGTLNYSLRSESVNTVRVQMSGDISIPSGKIILKSPLDTPLKSVTLNGNIIDNFEAGYVVINDFPADVLLQY